MDENSVYDTTNAKRAYSRVALAITVYTLIYFIFQVVFVVIAKSISDTVNFKDLGVWKWIITFAPQYLLALPCSLLVLFSLPAKAPEKTKLPTLKFLSLIPIAYAFMYAGSLIGNFLATLLSGGKATNALTDYVNDGNIFLQLFFLVVLGPLVEELLFRKLIIDRIARYGERAAVILSAALFALFHTNVYQLFYALGIGFILGYLYIRSGRLWYSYALHAFFNLLGGVILPFITSKLTALTDSLGSVELTLEKLVPTLLIALGSLALSTVILGVVVFGIVLLIKNYKKTVWKQAEEELPDVLSLESAFINIGVIVFVSVTVILTIFSITA